MGLARRGDGPPRRKRRPLGSGGAPPRGSSLGPPTVSMSFRGFTDGVASPGARRTRLGGRSSRFGRCRGSQPGRRAAAAAPERGRRIEALPFAADLPECLEDLLLGSLVAVWSPRLPVSRLGSRLPRCTARAGVAGSFHRDEVAATPALALPGRTSQRRRLARVASGTAAARAARLPHQRRQRVPRESLAPLRRARDGLLGPVELWARRAPESQRTAAARAGRWARSRAGWRWRRLRARERPARCAAVVLRDAHGAVLRAARRRRWQRVARALRGLGQRVRGGLVLRGHPVRLGVRAHAVGDPLLSRAAARARGLRDGGLHRVPPGRLRDGSARHRHGGGAHWPLARAADRRRRGGGVERAVLDPSAATSRLVPGRARARGARGRALRARVLRARAGRSPRTRATRTVPARVARLGPPVARAAPFAVRTPVSPSPAPTTLPFAIAWTGTSARSTASSPACAMRSCV